MKLMMSDYEVCLGDDDNASDFYVKFLGPKDSPYEGGQWKVHVTLPADYPYKSPSIGFCNKIFHPNVDLTSGSVCLDVINQTWSPMFDLVNIFQVFLPQLLLYPNPSDPLNGEAAALALKDKTGFDQKVRDMVQKYAKEEIKMDDEEESDEDKEEELSEMDDEEEEEAEQLGMAAGMDT